MPQPARLDHRPHGKPQRMDPYGLPGAATCQQRSLTQRPYAPGAPGPAPSLDSDRFRSRSLATNPRPAYQVPSSGYGNAPASTFREQIYLDPLTNTTMQGRTISERTGDDRTMSMPSYTRESDCIQSMSGRVIPKQRRTPGEIEFSDPLQANGFHAERPQREAGTASGESATSRLMSMASTVLSPGDGHSPRPAVAGATRFNSQITQSSTMVAQERPPLVYGALLSNIAQAFHERVAIGEKERDGLVYQKAFTGYEAVELISFIIRTSDRNLALLLGRSLDAQKYFHEVTYAHRLRDSPNEIYQFKESPDDKPPEANGIFTLLTECYSPTCNRDHVCYSIACPRRLEQQQRLNLKQMAGLKTQVSRSDIRDDNENERKLWINTVSKQVADSVTESERKRQEVISELMYTERDFVKDLEYLRDFWIKPLRSPTDSPIPRHRQEKFIQAVFSNCQDVHSVNSRMASALTRRQQQCPVVPNVGDVFLEYVQQFGPFIKYGSAQLYGRCEFEKEKNSNPMFQRFVDVTERLKESRKLELNGYLTKPTTRLARYPLLLEGILRSTSEDSPDQQDIPRAIVAIKTVLHRVNEESGKAENRFNLLNLNQQIMWGHVPPVDLELTEETRQIIFKGNLRKTPQSETADITVYLFDHAVLLVRVKMVNKKEETKVYRKPIPIELLQIKEMEILLPRANRMIRPSSSMIPGVGRNITARANPTEQGYPVTFKSLGKGGCELTLYCTTQSQRERWLKHLAQQKAKLSERHKIFTMSKLNEGSFISTVRINCCRPLDGGRKIVIGTDLGVYVFDRRPKDTSEKPKRVLDCRLVTKIEVLEQHHLIIILTDKVVTSYSLDALNTEESPSAPSRRGRRICNANYINAGTCNGQTLVCCVKSNSLSSTVKVYKPMDSMTKGKKKSGLMRALASGQDVLKLHKEFYIPMESNSIHFLRSKLCVGGAKGFEIVSLETLETQSLLDQADTSLDFIIRKEGIKPIHIERHTAEFLLCYTDFSFYVNKNGWRARADWKISWEGAPTAFATWGEKYILAFEPEFIEMRQSDTGGLVCILMLKNSRLLHSSSREILFAYEDDLGKDIIASLDFWGLPHSP